MPEITVDLYHVQPNLSITIMEELPERDPLHDQTANVPV